VKPAVAVAAILGAAALAATQGRPADVALLVAAAFLPYGLLLHRPPEVDAERLGLFILAAGLPLALAPTILSDDLFRYLWDAQVLAETGDPYRYAPDDGALAELHDAHWRRVNNPAIPTIYPPIAQLWFVLLDTLAHAPVTLKLGALGAHLGVAMLLRRWATPAAALAYGMNPLALAESASSGHVDVLVGGLVLAFAVMLARRRAYLAAVLAALASGVKLVGLALAPLLCRRGGAMALALMLGALAVVPLATAGRGSDAVGGLGQYARRWRGNELAYGAVEAGAAAVVRALGEDAGEGRVVFPEHRDFFAELQGGLFDPRASYLSPKKPIWDPAEFEVHVVAAFLARGFIVAFVLLLALVLGWRRVEAKLAARWVLLVGLLLAPQVHPWYLLWLLPLEAALERRAVIVWSAAALVAYAPLDRWVVIREWSEPALAAPLEYGLVAVALLLEARWRSSGSREEETEMSRKGTRETPRARV